MTIRILPIHFHILDTTRDPILIERDPSIVDLKNSFVETLNKYFPNLQRLREDTVLKTSARFEKAFTDDIRGEPHH